MPDLKRRVVQIDLSTDDPFAASTDPFTVASTEAIKLGEPDDFEEDVSTSPDALGRPIDVSRQWQATYFIREDESTGDDAFVTACKGEDGTVWVRETYQLQTAGGTQPAKVVGAPAQGCTVYTAEATVDNMKGTMVTFTSSSVVEGDNYQDEPTYA